MAQVGVKNLKLATTTLPALRGNFGVTELLNCAGAANNTSHRDLAGKQQPAASQLETSLDGVLVSGYAGYNYLSDAFYDNRFDPGNNFVPSQFGNAASNVDVPIAESVVEFGTYDDMSVDILPDGSITWQHSFDGGECTSYSAGWVVLASPSFKTCKLSALLESNFDASTVEATLTKKKHPYLQMPSITLHHSDLNCPQTPTAYIARWKLDCLTPAEVSCIGSLVPTAHP